MRYKGVLFVFLFLLTLFFIGYLIYTGNRLGEVNLIEIK